MKNLKKIPLVTILIFGAATSALADTITLRVVTATNDGTVRAAVYDSQKSFDDAKTVAGINGIAVPGSTMLAFDKLQPGTYGIAVYHDKNGNEELDRNLFGAPNEPFGFSNNPKIGFSAPKFQSFEFKFDGSPLELNITLNGS